MNVPSQNARTSRSGMVLILVLIMLALITGLVMQTQLSARHMLTLGEKQRCRAELQLAVQNAARAGLALVADDENPQADYLDEPWAQPIEFDDPAGVSVWMKIIDLNRYFDLNNLYIETPPAGLRPATEIVMDIMTLCGDFAPVDRVQAVKDWIDPDQQGIKESTLYEQKTPAYACADHWLQCWSDLLWIDGFSPEYLDKQDLYEQGGMFKGALRNNLAVIPVPRGMPIPLNVNTASKEALLGVVGLENESWVRQVLALRGSRPIASLDTMMAGFSGNIPSIRPWLGVTSDFFYVQVRAFKETQSMELSAMAQRTQEGHLEILRWIF